MKLIKMFGLLPLLATIYRTAPVQIIEKENLPPTSISASGNNPRKDGKTSAVSATASTAAIQGGGE
jgi:hypothetical protein